MGPVQESPGRAGRRVLQQGVDPVIERAGTGLSGDRGGCGRKGRPALRSMRSSEKRGRTSKHGEGGLARDSLAF